MAQAWYVETSRGVEGPLTAQDLAARAADGRLRPTDRVSQDRRRWAEATRVKGLRFPVPDRPGASSSATADTKAFARVETTPGYEIISALGAGACGVVYKARQVKLDRVVALKMVKFSGKMSASLTGRFEKEAIALAKLQHPNIVNVFDAGRYGEQVFFAMELLSGQDLSQRIYQDGRLDERTAWAIARQTAAPPWPTRRPRGSTTGT